MVQFDGRKRTALYFGQTSPGCILQWYSEIKQQLAHDGFAVTHLALATKSKIGKIVQAKRTEKRFIEIFKEAPDDAKSWDVYCIEEGVTVLSTCYLIHLMLLTDEVASRGSLRSELVFDFSVLDRVDIQKYMDITKRYIEWDKEFVFDCGKDDIPLSYSFDQNTEAFKEFK